MKKDIIPLDEMVNTRSDTIIKSGPYSIILVSTNDLIELSYLTEGRNSPKTCDWLCSTPSCGNSCGRCENCSCGYIESVIDYSNHS